MRPSDPDWVTDARSLSVQIQLRLLQQPPQKLLNSMPGNPATKRYEPHQNMLDKVRFMKFLLNLHAGEVRETYGFWLLVNSSLPESDAWYISQYPESQELSLF